MTSSELIAGTVIYEQFEAVVVLTLNRPQALNAINAELSRCLGAGLARADADPSVRAIVLTGAGRAFCAGADLKAVAKGEPLQDDEHPEWGIAGYVRHRVAKPTIAAVHGPALGGGTELVLASDLVVASEDAVFGLPEVTRGLVAGAGGLIRMPQQVPHKVALEMVLTGDRITAQTAERWGLVNQVVPVGDVVRAAVELGHRISQNAPLAVAESKALMRRAVAADGWGEEIWTDNDEVLARIFSSDDAHEGAVAFAEKRAPRWTGR